MAPEKSPEAFRTISEAADWLGTPAHVLRFWESRFPEIAPVKRAGGRRYYRPDDLLLIGGIKRLLHDEGNTIKSVQARLKSEGASAIAALSPPLEIEAPTDTEDPSATPTDASAAELTPETAKAKTPDAGSVTEPELQERAGPYGEVADGLPFGDLPETAPATPAFRSAQIPDVDDSAHDVASATLDDGASSEETQSPPRQGFFFDDAADIEEDTSELEQTIDEPAFTSDLSAPARDLPPLPDLASDPEDDGVALGADLPIAAELRSCETGRGSDVANLADRLRAIRSRLG